MTNQKEYKQRNKIILGLSLLLIFYAGLLGNSSANGDIFNIIIISMSITGLYIFMAFIVYGLEVCKRWKTELVEIKEKKVKED